MAGWDHLIEIKRIEKLSLSIFPAAPSCAAPADADIPVNFRKACFATDLMRDTYA